MWKDLGEDIMIEDVSRRIVSNVLACGAHGCVDKGLFGWERVHDGKSWKLARLIAYGIKCEQTQ